MDDRSLDDALRHSAPHTAADAPDARLDAAMQALARDARTAPERPGRRRRPLVLGIAAFTALALTAGGTLTAATLGIPPFVELLPGEQRTVRPIPFQYVTDEGAHVACGIWIDFRDADHATVSRVDEAIAAHDWSRFGQTVYASFDDLPPQPAPSVRLDPPEEVVDEAFARTAAFVADVAPEVAPLSAAVEASRAGTAHVSAITMSCRPDAL